MSGKCDEEGQLALLDAMVFFAAALIISSVLARSYAIDLAHDDTEPRHAQEVLECFLCASLGERVVIEMDGGLEIPASAEIGDCVATELHSIDEGASPEAFESMNEVLTSVLSAVVAGPYWFELCGYGSCVDAEPVLSLSRAPAASGTASAGSVMLPGPDEAEYLLVLRLGPPSLPEALCI